MTAIIAWLYTKDIGFPNFGMLFVAMILDTIWLCVLAAGIGETK